MTESYLSYAQAEQLLRGIQPSRVGKDGKGFSHVEAYEIRAHLNRIFGIARWSLHVTTMELIFEEPTKTKAGKDAWNVVYRAQATLVVRAPDGTELAHYTEWATGDSSQPTRGDSHDMALKTAESQALKRCAVNLGDQFGLSLYNNGATRPVVLRSLVMPEAPEGDAEPEPEVAAHIITPPAPESGAPTNVVRETSTPPAATSPSAAAEAPAPPPASEEGAAMAALADAGVATDVVDPLDWVASKLDEATRATPKDALTILNEALTVAVRQQLRQKRLPNSTETVGAAITRLMGLAAAAAGKSA